MRGEKSRGGWDRSPDSGAGARRSKEELGFYRHLLNILIEVRRKEEKEKEEKMPEVDRLKMVTDPARKSSQNERWEMVM